MQFNCQPVEKKNHWQSQAFHRGSQKGGKNSKYTVQVGTIKILQLFILLYIVLTAYFENLHDFVVISLGLRPRLITLASTLIIPDIKKNLI